MRLLLLLLLLVPCGIRTASGVALPPAGVFRYVRCPRTPRDGWGLREVGRDPKRKGAETQRGGQRPRERRTETRGGER